MSAMIWMILLTCACHRRTYDVKPYDFTAVSMVWLNVTLTRACILFQCAQHSLEPLLLQMHLFKQNHATSFNYLKWQNLVFSLVKCENLQKLEYVKIRVL